MNRPAILTQSEVHSQRYQNLALFRIYVAYRSILSIVLLILLVSPDTRMLVGSLNPDLYSTAALIYLATNIPLVGTLSTRFNENQALMLLVFLADIVAITLLADTSGGMTSGLPALLVITAASSAVLISNRKLAMLVAAISVLAILLDTAWLILRGVLDIGSLFPAGLLGLLVFGVALMVQTVAHSLGRAEALARNRASELYNLQRLNEQIVQHMQTGILLVNNEGLVRVMNQSAIRLLKPETPMTEQQGGQLEDYCVQLADQFKQWKRSGMHRAKPFSAADGGNPVVANFQALQPNVNLESLVLVEDYAPATQYAQSLKLHSLGRLTASIAHEIRNPLGAISHAAQLLQESSDLVPSDHRMADIIQHHSERVNHIVESVMQISRREPPKPEQLRLASWLNDFVPEYLNALNRPAEVTIDCDYKELLIEFDSENLQRIFSNLLDNALRHSKQKTGKETARIYISVDTSLHQYQINMIDNGSGVAFSDRAKLFEPFFTTMPEGSGMGLYLCKELCEINNASLDYRPTDKGESCFRISINQRAP